MHNPQNAGTIFRDCFIGSRAVGVAWIGLDPIRRVDRCFDPVNSDLACTDRFLRVLGESDHPWLAVVLDDDAALVLGDLRDREARDAAP